MTKPAPRPEASLIRLAREAAGLSPEKAAKRMDIPFSGSRWRQIEAGYRSDYDRPVIAKPPTLAHMAHAVGVTPDRLASAGCDEAARILREIERTDPPAEATQPQRTLTDLDQWQWTAILSALDTQPRTDKEKAAFLRMLADKIENQPTPPAQAPVEHRPASGDA